LLVPASLVLASIFLRSSDTETSTASFGMAHYFPLYARYWFFPFFFALGDVNCMLARYGLIIIIPFKWFLQMTVKRCLLWFQA
jgi:hypothetical protein